MSRKHHASLRDQMPRFRQQTIEHPKYTCAVGDMFVQLVDFDDPPIILFVGPAGAGKSRVLKFDLPHKLLGREPATSAGLTAVRPYVYTELPSVDKAGFTWIDYYDRGLIALKEPRVNVMRRALPDELARVMQLGSVGLRVRATGLARLQLETAMIERQVRWWVMDNSAALVYVASTSSYTSQLNTVMSLSNMTHAAIIVCSTYEILALIDLNGQLDRRIIDIELPRYNHQANPQDYDDFCNAVLDHLELSPVSLKGDPLTYLPMFYEGSLGLFGCWKVWFDRTLCEAIEHKPHTVTKARLAKWAYAKGKMEAMRTEMVDGEALYAAFKDHRQQFEDTRIDPLETNRKKKSTGIPGKRKAHHDPVDTTA